jgi:hypothetical protein
MQRKFWIVMTAVTTIAIGALGLAPASAQSSSTKAASDVGVTASEIHVATIADVDNPFSPGLFEGAKTGAIAAAKFINSKAGGSGVGGRKIVVDFLDSQLNPNKTRNSVITGCQNDFALVGTAVLFLTSADDLTNCTDKAGARTGVPDMPSFSASVVESCAPTAFGLNPPQLHCETATKTPQTYTTPAGMAKWLASRYGKGKLHGAMIYPTDTKDAERGSRSILDAYVAAGIKADQYVGMSATTPQSGYTGIVQKMRTDSSNFAYAIGGSTSLLKSEAQLQGLTGNIVWMGSYSTKAAKDPILDNTWDGNAFALFDEASVNPGLKTFLRYVPLAKADSFAVYGWSAMLAFAQAARAVIAKNGPNGLTRAAFLKDGVPVLTKFDANGLIGTTNMYRHVPTPCFVVWHLTGGKFKRVYPTKRGTFDCKPSNLVTTKADYVGG